MQIIDYVIACFGNQNQRCEQKTALFWVITQPSNYHYSLRNNPEERGSQLLLGGSLKSHGVMQNNLMFRP